MEVGDEIKEDDVCCFNCTHLGYVEVAGVPEEYCLLDKEFTNSWNKCNKFKR